MKAHTLHRLTQSLYNTPHLVTQSTFDSATAYLTARNKAGMMVFTDDDEPADDGDMDDDPKLKEVAGLGILAIQGALTYRPVKGVCGDVGASYTNTLEDAEEMLEAGCTTLIMDIDSGGGQGYGAFECANELRKMCDEYGATLIAYNDGTMASAAYVFGCVADVVVSNPYAETGSIGVLIALVNDSKHLEQEGYARQFITAGASKVPFDPDGSFREGFIEDLQTKVDDLYEDFVSHVATYTGLSAEVIKGTEAKVFSAKDALALGLINKVMTRAEFTSYVVDKHTNSSPAIEVGSRVEVKTGMNHPGMPENEVGTVREISTRAIGVEFDDMPGMIHKWYTDAELDNLGETSADMKPMKPMKAAMPMKQKGMK